MNLPIPRGMKLPVLVAKKRERKGRPDKARNGACTHERKRCGECRACGERDRDPFMLGAALHVTDRSSGARWRRPPEIDGSGA